MITGAPAGFGLRASATAEKATPMTKQVRVKLPRRKVMSSRIVMPRLLSSRIAVHAYDLIRHLQDEPKGSRASSAASRISGLMGDDRAGRGAAQRRTLHWQRGGEISGRPTS